jgi:hypothetical protein
LPAKATLTALYPADGSTAVADAGGSLRLDLAAQRVRVYAVGL